MLHRGGSGNPDVVLVEIDSGRWVVKDSTIKNEQAGSRTRMRVDAIDFSVKLPDAEFTQRALAGG